MHMYIHVEIVEYVGIAATESAKSYKLYMIQIIQ